MIYYFVEMMTMNEKLLIIFVKIIPYILLQVISIRFLFPKQTTKWIIFFSTICMIFFSLLYVFLLEKYIEDIFLISGFLVICISYIFFSVICFAIYKKDYQYLFGITLISLFNILIIFIFNYVYIYLLNYRTTFWLNLDISNWFILFFLVLLPVYKKIIQSRIFKLGPLLIGFTSFLFFIAVLFFSFFQTIAIGVYYIFGGIQIKIFVTETTVGVNLLKALLPDAIITQSSLKPLVPYTVSFFMLISLVFSSFLFLLFKNIWHSRERKRQQAFEYELIQYTESLEQLTTDVRKNHHDFNNILVSLANYIYETPVNQEALISYFEKITNTFSEDYVAFFELLKLKNIRNSQVKSLIFSKAMIAKNKQIKFSVEVAEEIPEFTMDTLEFLRILGILLDNAIEGVKGENNPSVEVTIFSDKRGVVILIMNHTSQENLAKKMNEKGFTTKGKNRGLGLSIVKQLVAKNKSDIYFSIKQEGTLIIQKLRIRGE